MRREARELCPCGSGLPFARCHGDPSNPYAREQALREAEAVAMLFPSVRLRSRAVDAFVERTARANPGDEVPAAIVAEGLALVDEGEQRRVVESWAEPYADRWEGLVETAADREAAERALLAGALRAAIAERQATSTELVELLEDSRLRRSPFAALAVVLPAPLVWSREEAAAAQVAARGSRPLRRSKAAEEVAHHLMTFDHIRRTQRLSVRLASELPIAGLPNASRILGSACQAVRHDLAAARAATAALLVAYVEQSRAT